ncbi:unnamed protein product [Linum trigynum]|uniref:Uncharacterized protein n=1 Tax=Linum trigynum TaxID=586398 RepID=A0AAV2F709_9ROSI
MSLCCGSSAIRYWDLMGEKNNKKGDESSSDGGSSNMYSTIPNKKQFFIPWIPMPELRRTKRVSSSMLDLSPMEKGKKMGTNGISGEGGSMVNMRSRAGSMLSVPNGLGWVYDMAGRV